MNRETLIRLNLMEYIEEQYEEELKDMRMDMLDPFLENVHIAAKAISRVKKKYFKEIYRDIREGEPFVTGVALFEKTISGGGFTLSDIEKCRKGIYAAPAFVEEWAANTLRNPFYIDILTKFIPDLKGESLSDEIFVITENRYLLITSDYEFHSLRVKKISLERYYPQDMCIYRHAEVDDSVRLSWYLDDFLHRLINIQDQISEDSLPVYLSAY